MNIQDILQNKELSPKEITRDELNDISSFSYYEGISYVKNRGLAQSVSMSDVRKGTHFIVCCGDVMVRVEASDFEDIERIIL